MSNKLKIKSKKKEASFGEIRAFFSKTYNYIDELMDRISNHKLFLLAGGLAFNILLYIIPLILIIIYLINVFIDTDDLIHYIETSLIDFLPQTDYYGDIIYSVISEIQRISDSSTIAGIIGIFALLWISSTVISTINTCISTIFNIEQPHYIFTKLRDLGITILLTILILIYSIAMPIVNFVGSYINDIFPDTFSVFLSSAILTLSSFAISFFVFYFIYGIIPSSKTKLPHWIVVRSTVIAVLMTEISRHIFTWYISTISNYTRFYGTYAVFVTLSVWLYYSCFIILFAAELANFWWDKSRQSK